MKFIKQSQINSRNVKDLSIATTTDGTIVLTPELGKSVVVSAPTSLTLPAGNATERPATPALGDLRFNVDTRQAEVFNGAPGWTSLLDGTAYDPGNEVFAETSILYAITLG